jgi:hypothetical protein
MVIVNILHHHQFSCCSMGKKKMIEQLFAGFLSVEQMTLDVCRAFRFRASTKLCHENFYILDSNLISFSAHDERKE